MRFHDITKDDMKNGDGLRVVLWVSGCEHKCRNCHNRITWDINCGILFSDDAKNEIFSELDHDYISGITFSGGDPLHTENREEIGLFAEEIHNKYPDKTIWLYTGYSWDDIKSLPFMKYIDVVVDGKYIDEKRNVKLHWRGSENQKVIDVKKSLETGKIVLHCA